MRAGLSILSKIERGGARIAAGLPERVRTRIAGGPIDVGGVTLDSQIRILLWLRERRGARPLPTLSPQRARKLVNREARSLCDDPPRIGGVRDLRIDGAAGPLRARHYRPIEDGHAPVPLLVYLHGGGFVTCGLDTHDVPCRQLCHYGGMHVLSIEYRLAPEHPFPAAVDDACAALRWAQNRAEDLGADPDRVAVGGDSAGGTLATVVSRLTTGSGDPPAAQLLIYPATHYQGRYPSKELFGEGFYLTSADITWYHEQYVGDGNPADPRVSPLLADDLSGLPPALIVTAGFDPLRDEGEAYGAALRAAGTPTVIRRFPSLVHGFLHLTGMSQDARDAVVEIGGMLRALVEATARSSSAAR